MQPDHTISITRLENILSTHDLSIGYPGKSGGKIISGNLSLNASSGELIALIGGNGVGKSTLLKTLAGLQPPLSGGITLNGKNISHYKETELAKILSFVSTEIIHVSNLTVFDLVALGRYPHTSWTGRLTAQDEQKVQEALEMVGLQGYEKKMINFISDGERQKAMIARTLAQDTDLVLLDEPTAFLDLSNKYEIVHILHRLASERGKTILFSTHDLSTATAECDSIWLMLEKEIKCGSPEDLILDGSYSSIFPNKNLYFDSEKGDFRILKKSGPKVFVSGEGNARNWTIKALERNGFQIEQHENSFYGNDQVKIECDYPTWRVKQNQTEVHFDSIYQLCRYIHQVKFH